MTQQHSRILVVDDHANARQSIVDTLEFNGHSVASASSGAAALQILAEEPYPIVITDLRMPGMSGLELLRALMERPLPPNVILITAHGTVETAVDAMRHGAFDFIEKPFVPDQLESVVQRALQTGQAVSQQSGSRGEELLLGESPAMQALKEKIASVAHTDETVLIVGESGTGKELIARTLHRQSRRSEQSLIALNCPALSPQLMESELFGHERGAFTGADVGRLGRFELADKGTLLLDEVSEIPPDLQAKLLRVLQEHTFERVGSSHTNRVDVRVIASTNRNLDEYVGEGRFRQDLFYRLAVLPIHVPPLRERLADVPAMAEHFLRSAASRLEQSEVRRLDDEAVELLKKHSWPGNVRELQNLMTRAAVLSNSSTISARQLDTWMRESAAPPSYGVYSARITTNSRSVAQPSSDGGSPTSAAIDCIPEIDLAGMSLGEMERRLIEATLRKYGGHREKTSQALGIGVRTLNNKLRNYGYAPRARFPEHASDPS